MSQYRTTFGRPNRSRYAVDPKGRPNRLVKPVSSLTSRTAQPSSVSPGSSFPFGNDQSSYFGL